MQEPFCILHTSGSTGVPKPIQWYAALDIFVSVFFTLIQNQVAWADRDDGQGAPTAPDTWR
jgi:acyl-coenzyme A synthetase/AMP-(fatty) acid ligase